MDPLGDLHCIFLRRGVVFIVSIFKDLNRPLAKGVIVSFARTEPHLYVYVRKVRK